MVDIASRSRGAILYLMYDIYHIAISVLRLIGEDHCIAVYYEVSTSYRSSIKPPMSSTVIRMQPIRGRGRGRGRGGR